MSYSITTPDELRALCIKNNWFTRGTNTQYERLFEANEADCSIEEIATIIWLCTDCENIINKYGTHWSRKDILAELKEAQNKYFSLKEYNECISVDKLLSVINPRTRIKIIDYPTFEDAENEHNETPLYEGISALRGDVHKDTKVIDMKAENGFLILKTCQAADSFLRKDNDI